MADNSTNGHPHSNGKPPREAAKAVAKNADEPPGLPQLPPEWHATPELRPVLISRDISGLYRWLNAAGVPQRQIAQCTGQSQSEVCEIFNGRRVIAYDVFVRVCAGLHIPRERMGLSYWGPHGVWCGPDQSYPGGVTVNNRTPKVDAAMLRRHLIALGGRLAAIMAGVPIDKAAEVKVGELLDAFGEPDPAPLPSKLTGVHLAQVQDLRQRLEEARRTFGADPATASAAAARAERLLTVPGPETVKQALLTAVAHLYIDAGISAFGAGLYQRTLHHLAHAVDLAEQAKDPYLQALALGWAGLVNVEHGHPADGLKILQTAQIAAWAIPHSDPRRAQAEACAVMDSATALAMLGDHHQAYRCVASSRDLWTPTAHDPYGDMDRVPAMLELERGRLDMAEQFATASVRRWEKLSPVGRTRSGVILATIHVKAGEQGGLQLAHDAIIDVTKLTSVRVRRLLLPLADALEARPGTDTRELARMARQIAA